jgi:hypothetical protein
LSSGLLIASVFYFSQAVKIVELSFYAYLLQYYFLLDVLRINTNDGDYLFYTVSNRAPVSVDVGRDRGTPLYKLQADNVENVYMLKVHNMDRQAHEFDFTVEGPHAFKIKRYRAIAKEINEMYLFPVCVVVDKSELKTLKTSVTSIITLKENDEVLHKRKVYLLPPN